MRNSLSVIMITVLFVAFCAGLQYSTSCWPFSKDWTIECNSAHEFRYVITHNFTRGPYKAHQEALDAMTKERNSQDWHQCKE